MKTKTIIFLIGVINTAIDNMFNGNEDAIEKYNHVSELLDEVIMGCVNRGENPHTIETDRLSIMERSIFDNSLMKTEEDLKYEKMMLKYYEKF